MVHNIVNIVHIMVNPHPKNPRQLCEPDRDPLLVDFKISIIHAFAKIRSLHCRINILALRTIIIWEA